MTDNDPVEKTESQLQALSSAMTTGTMQHARRMLNELEHAHIYIAQLETEKAKATAERAALAQMLATQQAELEAMKTLLHSLAD